MDIPYAIALNTPQTLGVTDTDEPVRHAPTTLIRLPLHPLCQCHSCWYVSHYVCCVWISVFCVQLCYCSANL